MTVDTTKSSKEQKNSGLSRTIVRGIKCSFVSQFGRQGIQFATTAALATLLKPEDFGVMGMAVSVIGFFELLAGMGTAEALVRHKNPTQKLLSSVFWLNLILGLTITLAVLAVSPIVSAFYGNEKAGLVLGYLSVNYLVTSLGIVQYALIQKDLDFYSLAKIELIATTAASTVAILSAAKGFGVFSLVYQALTLNAISTCGMWSYRKWRPSLTFSISEIKTILRFGLNLVGFSISNYISRNLDNLLIGKFLGAQLLGYYVIAYRIMYLPIMLVSSIIARVMFPVYSRMQEDDSKLAETYLRVTAGLVSITFPVVVGVIAVREAFVVGIIGSEWLPILPLLLILCPVGLLQSIQHSTGTLYQAKGRTDLMMVWGILSSAIFTASYVLGIRWGITGVAFAYSVANLILFIPGIAIPLGLIKLKYTSLFRIILRPLASSCVMLAALMITDRFILRESASLSALIILAITGGIIYLASAWFISRRQLINACELIGICNNAGS